MGRCFVSLSPAYTYILFGDVLSQKHRTEYLSARLSSNARILPFPSGLGPACSWPASGDIPHAPSSSVPISVHAILQQPTVDAEFRLIGTLLQRDRRRKQDAEATQNGRHTRGRYGVVQVHRRERRLVDLLHPHHGGYAYLPAIPTWGGSAVAGGGESAQVAPCSGDVFLPCGGGMSGWTVCVDLC